MFQKCSKIESRLACCSKIPAVLIGITVQLSKDLPPYGELGVAVALEHLRVALTEHLSDKVIGYSASAQSRGERVA
jgi:hypothetical protein